MTRPAGHKQGSTTGSRSVVNLGRKDLSRLERWARASYPGEACGLLVGTAGNGAIRIARVAQAHNLRADESNHHYAIDPEDFLQTERAARQDGLEVVGFWHSHPDHPPIPSPTDLAAAWPSVPYLILETTATGIGESCSWMLLDGAFHQQRLNLEDDR